MFQPNSGLLWCQSDLHLQEFQKDPLELGGIGFLLLIGGLVVKGRISDFLHKRGGTTFSIPT